MKRMIAFLFLMISLICFAFFKDDFSTCASLNYYQISLISKENYSDLSQYSLQNGNQFYYTLAREDAVKLRLENYDLDGIVYFLDENFDVGKFLNSSEFFYQGQSLDNGYEIYYGYDRDFDDAINLNGKKINFQLVVRENDILIGIPLVLIGY